MEAPIIIIIIQSILEIMVVAVVATFRTGDVVGCILECLPEGARSRQLGKLIYPKLLVNYARLFFRETPTETSRGVHVLQSYGYGDSYTPEPNMDAFARAMGLRLPTPFPGDLDGYREVDYPVTGNVAANGEPITGVIIPAQPDD